MSIRFTSILLFIFMCTFTIQASQEEQIVVTAILPKSDSWVSIATDTSWEHQDEIFLSSEKLITLKVQLLAEAAKKALADSFSSDEESDSDDELESFDDCDDESEKK